MQSHNLASGTASLATFAALSHDISSSVASILLSTTSAAIHPHLFQAWSFPPSPRSDARGAFTPDDITYAAATSALKDAPFVAAAGVGDRVDGSACRYAGDEQLPALLGVSWCGVQQPGEAEVLKQPAQRSISPTRERRKAAPSSPASNRLHCSSDRTSASHNVYNAMASPYSQGQHARCDPQSGASSATKEPSSSPTHQSPTAASRGGADIPRTAYPSPLAAPGVPHLFSAKPPRPPRHGSKVASRGLRGGESRKAPAGGAGRLSRLMGGRRKASGGEAAVMMPLIILLLVLFLVLTIVQGVLSTEQARRILTDPTPRAHNLTGLTWHDLVGQRWNGSNNSTSSSSHDLYDMSDSPYTSMNRKLGGSPPYVTSRSKQSLGHNPPHTLGQQAKLSLAGMAELSRVKHVATWPLRRLLR
ncbi:unnamed protein product [Closterium sp. NIES-53]